METTAPVLLAAAFVCGLFALPSMAEAKAPPTHGLSVWLDATQPDSILRDDAGQLVKWSSRTPASLHATISSRGNGPTLVPDAFGPGRRALRFNGQSWLDLPALADDRGSITVFMVFQRQEAQAGGPRWQRLLSIYDGVSSNDTKGHGVFLDTRGTADAMAARVFQRTSTNAHRGPVTIGRNQKSHTERLQGDLAEVLIYNRGFLVDSQYEEVESYLREKWGVVRDPRDDWTRSRPLGDTPQRVTDELPLSDQGNAGGWEPYAPMTDAFEGDRLDPTKWHDHNPRWYGRPPALFLPSNVEVKDGELHLTMRYDPTLPRVIQYRDSVYENYSSASVVSRDPVLYGYFEIESRAMDSAGSSAWWFTSKLFDAQGRASRTEIDVFELGGGAEGHEDSFHMNAHIFETPEDGVNKWNRGGNWRSGFRFADDYHVFGLEWTPEQIVYYVNGVAVRRMPNTHWHTPQYMLFDSETMTNWLGWPDPKDLPSTFSIRWVRAWKNAETRSGNEGKWFRTPHGHNNSPDETEITRFAREFEAKRREQGH
ncbi:MAG: family 16 glycosylhydrolase [Planctomycetota bacterium]